MRVQTLQCFTSGIAAAALVSAGLFLATEAVAQGAAPGSIVGKVSFTGEIPAPEMAAVRQDREACGSEIGVLKVEGQDAGLKNAVVRITNIESTTEPDFGEPTLDQDGCVFAPTVVLMAQGQELKILNNDGILHNIHTRSRENRSVNRSMPKFMKELKVRFRNPEIIPVRCDVHRWMQAYIVVAEHPYYAITANDGSFELRGVPDGTYTLEAWHAELGTKTIEVLVTAGQVSETTIAF
jgi:plastocyanin